MKILKTVFSTIFAALISTAVVFLILEGVCRLISAPGSPEFYERQIIKSGISPAKSSDEFRIFMFGESTMHGMQYAPRVTIARWLEEYLSSFLPGRKIEVVNFGRLGEVSAFVKDAVKTTKAFKPDLLVVYLGNNDFLPDNRSYDVAAEENSLKERIKRLIRKSYFVGMLNRLVIQAKWKGREDKLPSRDEIRFERDAQEFYVNDVVPPQSRYYEDILQFFKENLESIILFAKKEDVPIIFFKPISSLRLPPHYSLHLKALSPDALKEWQDAYNNGDEFAEEGNFTEALARYYDALRIDDTFASLLFKIGQVYDRAGFYDEAKLFYVKARDYDAAPTRCPTVVDNIIEALCEKYDVPLIDTEALFAPEFKGGISGPPLIEDNCHPSLRGQGLMAMAVAHLIADNSWIAPTANFEWQNEKTFDEYLGAMGADDAFLAQANFILTTFLLNLGPNYDLAIEYAKRGLEYEPDNADLIRRLAWLYWLKGDLPEAKAWYDKLGDVNPEYLAEVRNERPEVFSAIEK